MAADSDVRKKTSGEIRRREAPYVSCWHELWAMGNASRNGSSKRGKNLVT
jgi:hypothetical protein